MKILGIEFAPLYIPLERRLQTCAVAYSSFNFLGGGAVGILICLYILLFTSYYYLVLLYIAWIWYDIDICNRGGRRSEWVRKWPLWKYLRDYFPIELKKTAELDPEKNYIFGYHPHGIMCAGAFCNFSTEGTDFSEVFPGIKPHLLTLKINFYFPLYRELVLAYGACAVSRDSIVHILTKKGVGNAAVVVIGGAQEALDAHPGQYILTLKRRKGFVKLAIQCGADLVPVFSFGENDIFDQVNNPPGSFLRFIQEKMKFYLGFSPTLFRGRGIFQYSFGYIPFRARIVTIVGKPIPVEKKQYPTQDYIDNLHAKYIDSLIKLFNEHKAQYGATEKDLMVL